MTSILSSRFIIVFACGVLSLVAAFMNFSETASATLYTYSMFFSAALIFVCAGLLYTGDSGKVRVENP